MKLSYILFSTIFAVSLMYTGSSWARSEGHKKAARYMKPLPKKAERTSASFKSDKKAKRTPASKKLKSKKSKDKKAAKKIKAKGKKAYRA
jgi:hypothetical protein